MTTAGGCSPSDDGAAGARCTDLLLSPTLLLASFDDGLVVRVEGGSTPPLIHGAAGSGCRGEGWGSL